MLKTLFNFSYSVFIELFYMISSHLWKVYKVYGVFQ